MKAYCKRLSWHPHFGHHLPTVPKQSTLSLFEL